LVNSVSQISLPFTTHSRVASIFDEIAVSPGAFTLITATSGLPSGGEIGIKSRHKDVSNVYSVPFISIFSGAVCRYWRPTVEGVKGMPTRIVTRQMSKIIVNPFWPIRLIIASFFDLYDQEVSFALIDKRISFSPKNEYKLTTERGETASIRLKNSNWRRGWDSNPRSRKPRHTLSRRAC
jgi:hypothetical protein